MELIPIILAIITITIFYFLYAYFSSNSIVLAPVADLSSANEPIEVTSSVTRYAYGIWVYIDQWSSTAVVKPIFSRAHNISLSLGSSNPSLNCVITTQKAVSGGSPAVVSNLEITDNFPIQKWTHVVVNVDNSYIDCYLDGKLVKSKLIKDVSGKGPLSPEKTSTITLGSSTNAHITKFKYWNLSINPEDAWNEYKAGNGQTSISNMLSNYTTNITVLKDDVLYATIL